MEVIVVVGVDTQDGVSSNHRWGKGHYSRVHLDVSGSQTDVRVVAHAKCILGQCQDMICVQDNALAKSITGDVQSYMGWVVTRLYILGRGCTQQGWRAEGGIRRSLGGVELFQETM